MTEQEARFTLILGTERTLSECYRCHCGLECYWDHEIVYEFGLWPLVVDRVILFVLIITRKEGELRNELGGPLSA